MAKFEALPKAKAPKDLTGLRFGNLYVIDFSHRQRTSYATRIFWNCLCDCGITRQTQTYHLTSEDVLSCGKCQFSRDRKSANAKNKLPKGIAAMRSIYRSYKSNAKEKNRIFEVTFDDFVKLVSKDCHYCGSVPPMRLQKTNFNEGCLANGLDRVDSTKGYLLDNIVPCCSHCNTIKLDLTYTEFTNHIKKIHNHLKLKS